MRIEMVNDRQIVDNLDMKTDTNSSNPGNVWPTNAELPQLTHDECLPVIGNSHVTSILSHLDSSDKALPIPNNLDVTQTMEFIVLPNSDYKLTTPFNGITTNNFTPLKSNLEKLPQKLKPKPSNDSSYTFCDLCPFLCTNEKRLADHIQNVHQNGNTIKLTKFKCPGCINVFYHKMSLRSHLVNDHLVNNSDLNKIMNMISSDKLEFNKSALKQADISINCRNEFDLKCGEKLNKLTSEKMLNDDKIQSNNDLLITSNTLLACTNEINDSTINAATSIIINLPTIDIMPDNTDKMFNNFIKKHNTLSKFLDKKMQKCSVPLCKVRLQNMEKLNYHTKCHVDTSFKCPECSKDFSFWKPLTGHLWRLHKIDMELHSCDKCEYKTFSLGHLNNVHKLIHNDTKPFVCTTCLRGFKNSKQLRNHKSSHKKKSENSVVFACEVCTKSFSDRRQLRIHTDGVHKKIKPFLCNFCGYKGATKSSLRMHMRQHTGEKPFSCDSCSYTTADHNSMRRHKLRHSGEKPYKCTHCDYACIQSSTYKVHLKTKHPGLEKDLLYACPDCAFRSINRDIFTTHMVTVHKKLMDIL